MRYKTDSGRTPIIGVESGVSSFTYFSTPWKNLDVATIDARSIPTFVRKVRRFNTLPPSFRIRNGRTTVTPGRATITGPDSPTTMCRALLTTSTLHCLALRVATDGRSNRPNKFTDVTRTVTTLIVLNRGGVIARINRRTPNFCDGIFLSKSLRTVKVRAIRSLYSHFQRARKLLNRLSNRVPNLLTPTNPLNRKRRFTVTKTGLRPNILFPIAVNSNNLNRPCVVDDVTRFGATCPDTAGFLPVLI